MLIKMAKMLYSLYSSKHKSFKKKALFFTLFKVECKQLFQSKKNRISETFLGYDVIASNYHSLLYLFNEIYCLENYHFKTLSHSPVIIDCGTNIGLAVLYFKKLFPNSKIVAFEINPKTFSLLKENVEQNKLNDVELHNVGLYNKEHEMNFFMGEEKDNLKSSIKLDEVSTSGEFIKVKTEKLSNYLHTFDKIDLIKIDVEGAEIEIVDDLYSNSLLQKADQYIIEYHHLMNKEEAKLADFLMKFEASGFNYSIRANYYRIRGYQEILIHFYKR